MRYLIQILYLHLKMKISRGLRNNNPLNIRRNKTAWRGLSPVQSDKEFFCFTSAAWGYRAAFVTLRNYRKRHGLATLAEWIARWAPPVENDTQAYIGFVSRKAQVAAVSVVDIDDGDVMCRIVAAMSQMENGVPAAMHDVKEGYRLSIDS